MHEFYPMHFIDIIILIPLLWAAFMGFKKGFIIELAGIIALLFGIYGAIGFSDLTADKLTRLTNIQSQYIPIIAFVITFIAVVAAVFFIAKLLERIVKIAALGVVNRIAGSVFSVTKVILILSALFFVIKAFDNNNKVFTENVKQKSLLYKPVSTVTPYIFPGIEKLVNLAKEKANETADASPH